ncbi:MAG: nucleoside diphosphate kinase regulator [Rhodospirillales bacterium]|nr:nucleoside diphosphate kinase regulator [Rhodospirillales bacterium]
MSSKQKLLAIQAEPPVCLDAAYVDRLSGLAFSAAKKSPEIGNRLLNEIDRAEVLPTDQMSADVVNIGSTVTFRDEVTCRSQTVTLVLPKDADIGRGFVSVLTPIGVALLGLSESATISWQTLDGEDRRLTIVRVKPPASCE